MKKFENLKIDNLEKVIGGTGFDINVSHATTDLPRDRNNVQNSARLLLVEYNDRRFSN